MNSELGLKIAIRKAGGLRALGRKIGVSHHAIQQWMEKDEVPDRWLIVIEKVTGVARERLRPDLFRGLKITREKKLELV